MPTPSGILGPEWQVFDLALEVLLGNDVPDDPIELEQRLLNLDIQSFGMPTLEERIDKSAGRVEGPIVLQLTHLRDVSKPSLSTARFRDFTGRKPGGGYGKNRQFNPFNNNFNNAKSGVLRVQLTDGRTVLPALALERIPGLSEGEAPWGTKILLQCDIPMEGNFALITPSNCTVLGGKVERLVDRWKVEMSATREEVWNKFGSSDAPPWIPFGQRITDDVVPAHVSANAVIRAGRGMPAGEKEKPKDLAMEGEFVRKRREKLMEAGPARRKHFAKVRVPNSDAGSGYGSQGYTVHPGPSNAYCGSGGYGNQGFTTQRNDFSAQKPAPAPASNTRPGSFNAQGSGGFGNQGSAGLPWPPGFVKKEVGEYGNQANYSNQGTDTRKRQQEEHQGWEEKRRRQFEPSPNATPQLPPKTLPPFTKSSTVPSQVPQIQGYGFSNGKGAPGLVFPPGYQPPSAQKSGGYGTGNGYSNPVVPPTLEFPPGYSNGQNGYGGPAGYGNQGDQKPLPPPPVIKHSRNAAAIAQLSQKWVPLD